MKKYFMLKARKEDTRRVERILFNCLIDRLEMCSLVNQIELSGDEAHVYFVIGGQQYSCQRVLFIAKKVLTDENKSVKIFSYDTIKTNELNELIWISTVNSAGKTVKNYYNNPLIIKHIKNLTTKYMLKKNMYSNHVFCTECDGFADVIELSSLRGLYKCSYCNNDIITEGPLLTGAKAITHLNEKEQLYLIGLPSLVSNDNMSLEGYNGEQMTMPWNDSSPLETSSRRKRRRRLMFMAVGTPYLTNHELEQISWDLI